MTRRFSLILSYSDFAVHIFWVLLCVCGFTWSVGSCLLRLVPIAVLADRIFRPRSGELRTQILKFHLMRTQSLYALPLKPGVVSILLCMLRLLSGIPSLLISTLPVHSPAFFKNLSKLFPVLAAANTGSYNGPQNKLGHLAGCKFPC